MWVELGAFVGDIDSAMRDDAWLTSRVFIATADEGDRETLLNALKEVNNDPSSVSTSLTR